MKPQKSAIEEVIGENLDWMPLPDKIASRVVLYNKSFDPANESSWLEQFSWFDNALRNFNLAFRDHARDLDPNLIVEEENSS